MATAARLRKLPGRKILEMPINAEPYGLLGRFFLRGDQLLRDAGVEPRIAGPKELLEVNLANRDSWPPLLPNLDIREFPAKPDDILSIICYSMSGEAIATMATRRYDMNGTTLKTEADSLRFYYGARAEDLRKSVSFNITAPSAVAVTGRVSYLASLWIRPDHRKLGITRVIAKLIRYISYAQWPYDYEVFGSLNDISPPHVRVSYLPELIERGFIHSVDGKVVYQGLWCCSTRDFILRTLKNDVEIAESASTLGHVGRDQEKLFATSLERH